MEHYLTPFLACIVAVQLTYAYVAPAISQGKVVIKPNTIGESALFTAGMSIGFFIVYTALSIGIVVGLVPFLKEWTKFADDGMIYWMSIPVRLCIAQFAFFLLSIGAGKLLKSSARIEPGKGAWKVAWVPALVVVIADIIVGHFVDAYFSQH